MKKIILGLSLLVSCSFAATLQETQAQCAKNKTVACYNLGVMHLNGMGVEKNTEKALEYFTKACKRGDVASCTNIGDIHLSSGDPILAAHYYLNGCDRGDANSCKKVGNIYYGENIVFKRDLPKSQYYYKAACDLGDENGCNLYNVIK